MRVSTNVISFGFRSLLLVTSIAAFSGCGEKTNTNVPAAAPAAPDKQPAVHAAVIVPEFPPSDAEAQDFAKSFEKTLASGNTTAINATIAFGTLLRRAMLGVNVREDVWQNIVNSAKDDLDGPSGVVASLLLQPIAQEGSYRLLHVHRRGDEQRALFRRTTADGGIDYFDFVLFRYPDGKVRIGDWYEYSLGDLESGDLHQQFLCNAVSMSPDFLEKLSPVDRDYVTHESEVQKMREFVFAKKYQEALDTYQRMPELLKNHRHILLQRVLACCHLEGQFDEAIRAYRAAVPADPGVDLPLLDYYFVHRQFDDLLSGVDRLDSAVGGDPLLDVYRAIVHVQKGNLAAAKKCAQNGVAAEPESRFARSSLALVLQAEKNSPVDRPAGVEKSFGTMPGEPAGDAEARAFANAFAKTVASGDAAAVRAAIDIAAFGRRAIAILDVPEATRVADEMALFTSGAASNIANIFTSIHSQIVRGASFCLLHIHRNGGEQRALFRLVQPNGTVAYFDCILVRHEDGKVRIDDVYSFEAGENFSEILCRLFSIASEGREKTPQPDVAAKATDAARLATVLSEMTRQIKAGKYQAALDVCRDLPDRLQKEKVVLITRIRAARNLKGEPYDEAVRAYRKAFPNEPNMDLIMIDAYNSHKLFDRALASIDGLDRTVGGDPYLDAMRSQAYLEKGDLASAKRCAQKSVEGEPDVWTAYFCLLAISLKEKDFAETSSLLTIVREKFPQRMPTLAANPAYDEYLRSPEYRDWANAKKS